MVPDDDDDGDGEQMAGEMGGVNDEADEAGIMVPANAAEVAGANSSDDMAGATVALDSDCDGTCGGGGADMDVDD